MDRTIIGCQNAGFDIIEAEYVTALRGICLGKSGAQFVTWYFREDDEGISFYFGHYFPGTGTAARIRATADYHHRLAEQYEALFQD